MYVKKFILVATMSLLGVFSLSCMQEIKKQQEKRNEIQQKLLKAILDDSCSTVFSL
jgi:hypothetical protein